MSSTCALERYVYTAIEHSDIVDIARDPNVTLFENKPCAYKSLQAHHGTLLHIVAHGIYGLEMTSGLGMLDDARCSLSISLLF